MILTRKSLVEKFVMMNKMFLIYTSDIIDKLVGWSHSTENLPFSNLFYIRTQCRQVKSLKLLIITYLIDRILSIFWTQRKWCRSSLSNQSLEVIIVSTMEIIRNSLNKCSFSYFVIYFEISSTTDENFIVDGSYQCIILLS